MAMILVMFILATIAAAITIPIKTTVWATGAILRYTLHAIVFVLTSIIRFITFVVG